MSTENPTGASASSTGAPPPSGPQMPPYQVLRRSRTERKLAGVCGGLGRWSNIDPVVYRIAFVVTAFFGGLGLVAYGVLWLIVPVEGETTTAWQQGSGGHGDGSIVWPILAIIAGLTIAGGSWVWAGPGPSWVLIAAAVVVAIVLVQRSRGDGLGPPAHETDTPSGTTPAAERTASFAASTPVPSASGYGGAPTEPLPPYGAPPPPQPRRERSILGGLTVSVALIAVGLLISWGFWSDDPVDAQTALSVALAVVGLGLVVGTLVGRARGLIVLGVILSLVVLTTGLSDLTFRGGVGERDWHPTSVAALDSPYELSVGEARLDLTDLAPLRGGDVAVTARVGIGNLVVVIPDDVTVDVRAHAGTGNITLPEGQKYGGVGVTHNQVIEAEGPARGTITLNLRVGVGDVEVRHA